MSADRGLEPNLGRVETLMAVKAAAVFAAGIALGVALSLVSALLLDGGGTLLLGLGLLLVAALLWVAGALTISAHRRRRTVTTDEEPR